MSACGSTLQKCAHSAIGCVVLIMVILLDFVTGKNCSHPIMPEHVSFRCESSPCQGFPHQSTIHYICESGYFIPGRRYSRCRKGTWDPPIPTCILRTTGHVYTDDREVQPLPSVATTAVGVSIFLLTTTACMVIKSRLYPCQSTRHSPEQMDLMVDGLPVSLPTYEEAVYGSWGQRLTPTHGPTQLLLAQETNGHSLLPQVQVEINGSSQPSNESAELPPPPYEEVQSRSSGDQTVGDGRTLHIALSEDKDS
ncbi:sushi domain-containing protein 6 [Brienomyrus brachyistius]|uniref:sushi domain-containing protein 6 n=1 Tax=Brienomyrus brachyistius TaxID=42636 RepID=UPI0020B2DB95|nr:sushi domain-containing protein 6 [Brienomyrus brachyistius]XP_048837301.1 sushi domain-containing protein 6 [Brienomyrus brachyistius]XP_048837302.1 sushi domain-containing protein 6 [Brienomyrus brachyistius]